MQIELKSSKRKVEIEPITTMQRLEAVEATRYSREGGKMFIQGVVTTTYLYAAFGLGLTGVEGFDLPEIKKKKYTNAEIMEIGNKVAEEDQKGGDPTSRD